MDTPIPIDAPALLRLLHLVSPSLPVGAFTYSQGLEWAAETGWVRSEAHLEDWLSGLLDDALPRVDLAVLARLHRARLEGDPDAFERWTGVLLAQRETSELRAEEANRGRAMATLLTGLGLDPGEPWREALAMTQLAGFALAAADWGVPARAALAGWAWAWLDGQVLAAVKIVPLGQSAGQRVLYRLAARIPPAVDLALSLGDADLGASASALAIASSRHETQYTRLFRS